MRVSINVTAYPGGGTERLAGTPVSSWLAEIAAAADDAGIDTLWLADHLLQADPTRSVTEPMLEAFTTLGYLAHASARIRLGTMVAAATYRAPALLIKSVTTLDALSGGRVWLGLGAGYQQDEADAMGLDLPDVTTRFARLDETLRLARQMFTGDDTAFNGAHHRLSRPISSPTPAQPPPILVGGSGERRTLRLVARYADACNLFDIPDGGATITRKLAVLRAHCEQERRDVDDIDRTVSTRWDTDRTVDDLVAQLDRLAGYGVTHAVLLRPAPWTVPDVASLAHVVQRCADH